MASPALPQRSQAEQDDDHLRLLSIFHYIVAAMAALGGCFPIIHMVIGIAAVTGKLGNGGHQPPPLFGWIFIAGAGSIMFVFWSLAVCLLLAARNLKQRRRYTFCFVVACVATMMCVPFGTALGIFTILVLVRPSVKALFGAA